MIFFITLISFTSLCFVVASFINITTGIRSNSWTEKEVIISKSELGVRLKKDKEPRHSAIIEFSYTHHGKEITCVSHRLTHSGSGDKDDILQLISQYPLDKKVKAYIHPLKPYKAELVQGVMKPDVQAFFISLAIFGATLYWYIN